MLLEKEKTERRCCVLNHVQEAGVLLEELGLIREELAEEKRISIEKYCWRRSGWSHLQVLRLRGNPIGNEGAKALASALRHEMDLEDEEVERIQKDLSSAADRLVNQLVKGYQRTMIEEARGRDRIVAERGQVFNSLTTVTLHNPAQGVNNGLGEEDEEINVLYMGGDNEGGVNDITHGSEGQYGLSGEVTPVPYVDVLGDAGRSSLEEEVALLLEVCGKWAIRVERRKRCVPYLRLLDLGSCGIGSSGLKFIGNVLAENKSLEALLLRRNIFGRKQMKVPVDDDDSRSEEERPADRVDVPLYVSPGCISLFTALKTNRTLKVLDLGYNNMYPATIRVLAEALHENTTLTSLSLEGNRIGYGGSAAEAAQVAVECVRMEDDGGKHSCFLELLLAISKGNITTLLLGYNDLSQCWGDEEVKALASVCNRLEVLHLAGNQLGSEDIMKWANAGGADFTLKELHLTRNSLRGPEGGVALSGILRRCKGTLQDLFLDQNPLGTLGVAEAFMSHELPFLRLLSIRNAEVTQACAFPASSLTSLQHLLISDNPFTATELLNVADLLRSNARNLGSLSLWSRVFDMETIIPELREIVRHMPRLLFADFGVLLRFDGVLDAQDAFGQMEATFTARRMEQFFSTLPTELK
uniref:Uncharacterized protein TCIL3000_10_12500 n=1 Tax=Trypanosoma congolense (strain IL3000) TaxID=1068625 RepID=G0UYK1_TRYCI|nr:unnamed protein product [Trypanosoma congolense IL3000]